MNIYEELRKDHDVQRELMAKVVDTSGDTEERRRYFKNLKGELAAHASGEEKHFYSELMKVNMTIELARHSVSEHKDLDDLVEKLDDIEFSSTGWLTVAKALEDKLLHHLKEEEHEVFPLSGKVLSESQKAELAEKFRDFRNKN